MTKNKIVLLIFILTAFGLASCKKDYYCWCYYPATPQLEAVPPPTHDTKRNAIKKCEDRKGNAKKRARHKLWYFRQLNFADT